ncbi:hypothetical protein F2Q69_00028921 [Brassica cretica]|uniref:Uncharacterized protein n=1 Tax=Brassica cretica TaxID=69181 RepID=A0A8S9RZX7_BRACR|nr:hypothetical protein F2Q69_00028921 [Brassica cretica]
MISYKKDSRLGKEYLKNQKEEREAEKKAQRQVKKKGKSASTSTAAPPSGPPPSTPRSERTDPSGYEPPRQSPRKSREISRILASIEMARTRGGGQVGSRRSRRNQGLEVEDLSQVVASATKLKVKKRTAKKVAFPKKNLLLTPTRRRVRIQKVAAQREDVTLEDDYLEYVTPGDDEVEDVTPEDGGLGKDNEAAQDEKEMSNAKEDAGIEGEACLTGQEQKEDEVEDANGEEDGLLNDKVNEEEAASMEEDGVLSDKVNEEEDLNMEEDGIADVTSHTPMVVSRHH